MRFPLYFDEIAKTAPATAPPKLTASNARINQLLAALPTSTLARWLPHLELVDMPLGQVLHESGVGESYVYFP